MENSPIVKRTKITYDVSIIIPIYNGEPWIVSCFNSIIEQTAKTVLKIEICICNDGSTDNTKSLLVEWKEKFENKQFGFQLFENNDLPKGVGYGKNKAVEISTGTYLCFQDIDDLMEPNRVLKQYETAINMDDNVLLGSQFKREPLDSTIRYTKWANSLGTDELNEQIYTSNGPTIIMPTWFCHKNVFHKIGGFCEDGKGTPEDLIFFYKHLDFGGVIARTNLILLTYRYHSDATTFTIKEQTIWNLRLARLETKVLINWPQFTIWNAGKQGRRFYKSLSKRNQNKVIAFCDVDEKKIGKCYEPFDANKRCTDRKIKIINFKDGQAPFVICVKLDMTYGQFEENLKSLKLKEGVDFIYFS